MKNKRIIKGNFDFQNIISKQKTLKNIAFVLYFEKTQNNFLEYGISVGKKIGNAVIRNKIKRQIRMMISEIIQTDNGGKNFRIVIIARKAILDKDFEFNKKALTKLIEQLK
ncbi:ribonuclease P protein component [Mesoplasma syrphidae]|uniref:Ribonuclease P protein component n=1 Tax=Mesoplasma syrphidae TaxID=225999 RepID=A0A2K9BSD3_9MOLU|nr:ribonuclease P protein component [Mesoplasma syrphidae]AUF83912.1 ribonuclease P protein component [Mesoplasma syrphidae]